MRGGKGGGKRQADSTDAVATFLTRRFGLAGGLAWLGILTFGVVSEQLKTRREVREAIENTKEVKNAVERVSPTGVRSTDVKTGGGKPPPRIPHRRRRRGYRRGDRRGRRGYAKETQTSRLHVRTRAGTHLARRTRGGR